MRRGGPVLSSRRGLLLPVDVLVIIPSAVDSPAGERARHQWPRWSALPDERPWPLAPGLLGLSRSMAVGMISTTPTICRRWGYRDDHPGTGAPPDASCPRLPVGLLTIDQHGTSGQCVGVCPRRSGSTGCPTRTPEFGAICTACETAVGRPGKIPDFGSRHASDSVTDCPGPVPLEDLRPRSPPSDPWAAHRERVDR